MFKSISALVATSALLVSPLSAFASSNPTLQWNGEINRSCSLTADQVGRVVLNGQSGNNSRLDSTVSGGRPAILGYEMIGGEGQISFVSGSVTRNGQERLINGTTRRLEIRYEGENRWDTVFQNNSANWVSNQRGISRSGSGQVEVDARTNAHLTQDRNVETGTYVVRTVMACTMNVN